MRKSWFMIFEIKMELHCNLTNIKSWFSDENNAKCPIVKSMISLYKLKMRQFLFINSEILENYSLGIDTSFATMRDQPTHNSGILVQPNKTFYFYEFIFKTVLWSNIWMYYCVHLIFFCFADPGEASGCSTKSLVIH